jgi:hypothetical protein
MEAPRRGEGRCRGGQKIKNQKSKGKRQKAKMKTNEPQLIRNEDVFIFAFCLLPFAF